MYVRQKAIPLKKVKRVEELVKLFESYDSALIVNITGVTAPVLHEVRAKLRRRGSVVKVVKNTLARLAIEKVSKKKKGLEKLKEYLNGQNAVIFTNENVFALKLFLDKNKIPREARAGDIAQDDIVIPSGNTNFAPGPILSLFSKLKIPTSIKEGSVWVTKDTVVAKAGEEIPAELADLLKKLGIKPIKVGLDCKAAYTDGVVIPKDILEIDLEEFRKEFEEAAAAAFNLAFNAVFPTPETIDLIVKKAHIEALNLSVNAAIPVGEALPLIIAKAHVQASILKRMIDEKSG